MAAQRKKTTCPLQGCGFAAKTRKSVLLGAILASGGLKAFGLCIGLRHVFALFGFAKMVGALAVVNLAISISPYLTWCSGRRYGFGGRGSFNSFCGCGCSRSSFGSSRCRGFGSTGRHAGTSSKQTQSSAQRFNFHGKTPLKKQEIKQRKQLWQPKLLSSQELL